MTSGRVELLPDLLSFLPPLEELWEVRAALQVPAEDGAQMAARAAEALELARVRMTEHGDAVCRFYAAEAERLSAPDAGPSVGPLAGLATEVIQYRPPRAMVFAERAMALAAASGDAALLPAALRALAGAAVHSGEDARAADAAARCIEAADAVGDAVNAAFGRLAAAQARMMTGDWRGGQALLAEGLEVAAAAPDAPGMPRVHAFLLQNRADLAFLLGEDDASEALAARAAEMWARIDAPWRGASAALHAARRAWRDGRPHEARAALEGVLAEGTDAPHEANVLELLIHLALEDGRVADAEALLERHAHATVAAQRSRFVADHHALRGMVRSAAGDEGARASFETALELARAEGDASLELAVLSCYAVHMAAAGSAVLGAAVLDEALGQATRSGYVEIARQAAARRDALAGASPEWPPHRWWMRGPAASGG
jgi:hypothetical protein